MTDDGLGFQAPQTITPEGLADDLTVLVWESFTDFISERESSSTFKDGGPVDEEGQPDRRTVEEALIFEKRVSTRYAQYHAAAAVSDVALGEAVVHHLTGSLGSPEPFTQAVTERALEVTGPLRDYLEEVQLVP